MAAFSFSILQGMLSGPVALLGSTSDNSFSIPWVCITRGGMLGCGDVGMFGKSACSWVNTD